MKIALELFHGRSSPDETLDDWGRPGPVFLVEWVHVIYLTTIRLGLEEPVCDGELHFVGDLVFYDGCYYGDWSVFSAALVETDAKLKARLALYDSAKAIRPRKREEKAS